MHGNTVWVTHFVTTDIGGSRGMPGVVFESVPRENQSRTVSNRQMPIQNCHILILMGDPI